ncbi:MAG: CBS domain-containing protein [Candidatus Binatia bacterium]
MADKQLRVADFMTAEPVTLQVSDHLDLTRDLTILDHIPQRPVLSDGQLVGVVTQRDLFRAAISSTFGLSLTGQRAWLAKIPVAEVMTAEVITANIDWTVQRAVDAMLVRRIGCLPVIDGERLAGLMTTRDCLRILSGVLSALGLYSAAGARP